MGGQGRNVMRDLAIVCVALLLGTCSCAKLSHGTPSYILREQLPLLSVNGEGKNSAKPDIAIVRMGAEFQEEQASSAHEKVNSAMTRGVAAIKAVGIDEKQNQTAN